MLHDWHRKTMASRGRAGRSFEKFDHSGILARFQIRNLLLQATNVRPLPGLCPHSLERSAVLLIQISAAARARSHAYHIKSSDHVAHLLQGPRLLHEFRCTTGIRFEDSTTTCTRPSSYSRARRGGEATATTFRLRFRAESCAGLLPGSSSKLSSSSRSSTSSWRRPVGAMAYARVWCKLPM